MNLPAHLQRYQTRDIGQTLSQNLGTAAPPYVSIQGGRFNLIDAIGNEMPVPTFDAKIGVYLDAVIIDANEHLSRIYYSQKFDPSAATFNPPDCWSDNGVAPSVNCSSPQAPSCTPDPNGVNGCRWAVWGSAISANNKEIPACQQVQKIAIMTAHAPGTVFLLRVPPNSHKNLRAYQETCKGSGVLVANVITRIYFDQTTQGTLLFKGVTYIDEATAELRQKAWDEKKTDTLVGRTDVPRIALASPAQQGQIAAPQPNMGVAPGQPGGQLQSFAQPQVQQPGPFQPATAATTHVFAPAVATSAGQISPTTSPSDPAPAQRRRRRSAAEMAAAQQPAGQAPQAAQVAPQAPFPVNNQQPVPQFGIAQGTPASENPELKGMLDGFFNTNG